MSKLPTSTINTYSRLHAAEAFRKDTIEKLYASVDAEDLQMNIKSITAAFKHRTFPLTYVQHKNVDPFIEHIFYSLKKDQLQNLSTNHLDDVLVNSCLLNVGCPPPPYVDPKHSPKAWLHKHAEAYFRWLSLDRQSDLLEQGHAVINTNWKAQRTDSIHAFVRSTALLACTSRSTFLDLHELSHKEWPLYFKALQHVYHDFPKEEKNLALSALSMVWTTFSGSPTYLSQIAECFPSAKGLVAEWGLLNQTDIFKVRDFVEMKIYTNGVLPEEYTFDA